MKNVYETFFTKGEVVEVRALGIQGKSKSWKGWARDNSTISGYYDNAEDLARDAAVLDDALAIGVWFTINPPNPSLLARSLNRLTANPKNTTTDDDITCLRWLPIDLDPKRPAGISATEAETKTAGVLAKKITEYLEQSKSFNFSRGIRAFSGNGYHILYRLPDLPNDDTHRALIKRCVEALGTIFQNESVDVDQKVYNPARIVKLYGTTGRKGDSTAERPHRASYLFPDTPERFDDIPVTPIEQLKKLAALAPEKSAYHPPSPLHFQQKTTQTTGKAGPMSYNLGTLDVAAYLTHYGRKIIKVKEEGNKTRYCLAECVFNSNHKNGQASIVIWTSYPWITYQCFHDSCTDKTWEMARKEISDDDPIMQFYSGYDPNWEKNKKAAAKKLKKKEAPISLTDPERPFLKINDKGRYTCNPAIFANFLEHEFVPLFNEDEVELKATFYHYYPEGVWKVISTSEIKRFARNILGDDAKPKWIDDGIKLLQHQTYRPQIELESDPMIINLKSGMFNLITHERFPHDPKYYSRVQLPVEWDTDSECPLWMETLKQIFADDPKKIDVLQQFFGYCLYPKIIFPCALFQIGGGSNGKGTISQVLTWMLGEDNVSNISLQRMEEKFGIAELRDKLLNVSGETITKPLEVARFKEIAVGERVQADQKYKPDIKFYPIAKHMIAMNDFPGVKDKTTAFFRRIIVLEFTQEFTKDNNDKRRKEKLREELSGIFMWSIEGLIKVLEKDEIVVPESVVQAKQRFRSRVNPVLTFVDEECVVDCGLKVLPKKIYDAYLEWCDESKIKNVLGKQRFYEQILLNFSVTKKRIDTKDMFYGIGLLD